jgi:hypothetical protein
MGAEVIDFTEDYLKQERVLGNGINRNNNGKFQLDKKSYMN